MPMEAPRTDQQRDLPVTRRQSHGEKLTREEQETCR
jgi:hypothetical protein